jgi:hypothetical protein
LGACSSSLFVSTILVFVLTRSFPLLRKSYSHIRAIRKVRQTQHQNPEFGHTKGESERKLANKYISIQRGMKLRKPTSLVVNWVSSCISFFLSNSTADTYIFTAPNCTTTIISLELCALNAEFQHFILRFNKMSLLWAYRWERG